MARWTQARRDAVAGVAHDLLAAYSLGRVVVGVDGPDGAGKTRFADDLATELRSLGHEVFRASMDDFHRPRGARYAAGRESARGFYEDSYDYDAFRRVLLGPFRLAGSTGFSTTFFDLERDVPVETSWQTGSPDAILLIDGLFLQRPELAGVWNYVVWVDAPDEVRRQRMVARDGSHPGSESAMGRRYLGGQALYQEESSPRAAASAIIDNTDYDAPVRRR